MKNVPKIKLGIVAVSRDCFPIELSRSRRDNVVEACKAVSLPVVMMQTIIENENHTLQALEELKKNEINALVIYLGNFGPVTIFRLQSTADTRLKSYIAQGEVLDVDPQSFGSIGVFAVKEMGRFYRHVLIEKRYPHHTAVAFAHTGKAFFAATRMLGVEDISFNRQKGHYYPTENPFA